MKKTYYLLCLLKRWALLLSIAIIIGILITSIIEPIYLEKEVEWNADWSGASCWNFDIDFEKMSGISGNVSEEEKEAAINYALFELCQLNNNPEIIRESTGESILPQESRAVLAVDGLKKFYSCPLTYFESFDWKSDEWAHILRTYYYNGNKFLPGKLAVDVAPKNWESDLTPDDTEGYTYVDDYRSNLLAFYEAPNYSREIREQKLDLDTELVLFKGSQEVFCKKVAGFMRYKCYEYTYTSVGEEEFTLIFVYDLPLWKYRYDTFAPIYIGLFVGSLIIAAFIAVFDYKRQEKLVFQKILTSGLAHDLKSPLTVISGYAENLDANLFPEKREFYIQGIEENVGYMSDIITNILDMSRSQVKRGDCKTRVSIADICNEIINKYDSRIIEKNLEVIIIGDVSVKGNRISMIRAFDNLINNAIKNSPENGRINIVISKRTIEISNAYTNEIKCKPRKLLEPFVKGDESRGTSGTGVGLSIVDKIMNIHGFYVDIKVGELFIVKLTLDKVLNKIRRNKLFLVMLGVLIILIIVAYSIWRYNYCANTIYIGF